MQSAPSTSRRLLALLSLLQAQRDWPAPVLAQRLEISERTVRRDVDRLRELDYTIEATRGPDGGYRLGAGSRMPPLMFDDEQAVAIALALRAAGALGAGLEEAAGRALRTIGQLMPSRLSARIEGIAANAGVASSRSDSPADPEVLLRIGEAIRAGEELRFDYGSSDSDTDTDAPVRRTEPHHLLLHSGRWYLIGYSVERDDWRTYRVDRIRPKSHNGRRFTARVVPGGDTAAYLSARFKGSASGDTWPCWGEATLRAPLAAIAPYIEDGTVEELEPGSCRVRLGAWSWGGLAATLARFEATLDEVEPADLRDAFARLADVSAAAARA